MTFEDLVEKLAQKYADDVNPCRMLSNMAPRSSWYYKREATVAINMLWPVVEALQKWDSIDLLVGSISCEDDSERLVNELSEALKTLQADP